MDAIVATATMMGTLAECDADTAMDAALDLVACLLIAEGIPCEGFAEALAQRIGVFRTVILPPPKGTSAKLRISRPSDASELEGAAGGELAGLLRGDLDGLPGVGVHPVAGGAILHEEGAEALNGDLSIPAHQLRGDGVEHGVDDLGGLGVGEAGLGGDLGGELRLVQGNLQSQPSFAAGDAK